MNVLAGVTIHDLLQSTIPPSLFPPWVIFKTLSQNKTKQKAKPRRDKSKQAENHQGPDGIRFSYWQCSFFLLHGKFIFPFPPALVSVDMKTMPSLWVPEDGVLLLCLSFPKDNNP